MRAQSIQIPLARQFSAGKALYHALYGRGQHLADRFGNILAVENVLTLLVNDSALLIHHVVVSQHVLSALEVTFLNVMLCRFDGARQ